MEKRFWGYKDREEAEKFWPKSILESGTKTEKVIAIVDDATKWPQTSSQTKVITRIELDEHIVSY